MAEPIKSSQVISDDHVDDHVDDEIRNCFMSEPPKSFFMFAGAGSGKTRRNSHKACCMIFKTELFSSF